MYPIVSSQELLQQRTQLFVHRVQVCGMHRHLAMEALWVLQGSIRVQVNDRQQTLNAGDLLFINGNEHHATEAASDDNLVFCLQHRFADSFSVDLSSAQKNPVLNARQNDLRKILAHLWWEQKHQPIHWQLASDTYLARLQLILQRYFSTDVQLDSESGGQENWRIQQIMRFLESNHRETISLPQLAEQFGLSESYLSHFFKDQTGTSLLSWLRHLRLECALSDLVQTDSAISEVALARGFPSIKAFNTAFKREYRCTPSEFRERQKAEPVPVTGLNYGSYDSSSVEALMMPWLEKSELFLDDRRN